VQAARARGVNRRYATIVRYADLGESETHRTAGGRAAGEEELQSPERQSLSAQQRRSRASLSRAY